MRSSICIVSHIYLISFLTASCFGYQWPLESEGLGQIPGDTQIDAISGKVLRPDTKPNQAHSPNDQGSEYFSKGTIVKIDDSIGGLFPVSWSNGDKTFEFKNFLENYKLTHGSEEYEKMNSPKSDVGKLSRTKLAESPYATELKQKSHLPKLIRFFKH